MSDLKEILLLVQLHHEKNPGHGVDCACQDEWIREIREMMRVQDHKLQRRIDYIIRASIDHR